MSRSRRSQLTIGQLRRKSALRTAADYRVMEISEDGGLVRVEVVSAPGLRPGDSFTFARDALDDTELVADAPGYQILAVAA
jgi:hypothetical protein